MKGMSLSRKPELRVINGESGGGDAIAGRAPAAARAADPLADEASRLDLMSRLYEVDDDLDQLRLRAGESVLVLACGTGLLARHAARAVGDGRAVGVERNPVCLAHAAHMASDEGVANLELQRGGLPRLAHGDASFDAVFARHAIDLAGGRATVAEGARLLRPGGRLVLAQLALFPPEYTPAGLAFTKAFRQYGERAFAGTVLDPRVQRHLATWMLAAGLVDLRVVTVDDPAFGGFGGELARAWHWDHWWRAFYPRWVAVAGARGAGALRERHLELVEDPHVHAMCTISYVVGHRPVAGQPGVPGTHPQR